MNNNENLIQTLLKQKYETSFSVSYNIVKGYLITPENVIEFQNNIGIETRQQYEEKIDNIEKALNLIF